MRFVGIITALMMVTLSTAQESKQLVVPKIATDGVQAPDSVSVLLEKIAPWQQVAVVNWPDFDYMPKVAFRIAHDDSSIWLKFYVEEEYILAQRTTTNSATHRDSCVEFFMDVEGNGNYYNFEFNSIGTVHLAYGPNVRERTFIDPETIAEHVLAWPSMGHDPIEEKGGGHSWTLLVRIDTEAFANHPSLTFADLRTTANFYKCADDTPKKHYLSWNPVGTPRPNFHSPQYFGRLQFE